MKGKEFTHIDESGNPRMVDVSNKQITKRIARAEAIVKVGPSILHLIRDNELITKKGPVFQTAIIAGIMGAKKTAELIPMAHPIGMEDCQVFITARENDILIESVVSISSKTGVEMEALTAVSIAALTIYDMCKALSHDITITNIRLMEKTGGKQDFNRSTL